jgi:hypothetical protein
MSDSFFEEGKVLWEYEQTSDSLPTAAAAQLLSLSSIYNGHDGGLPYLRVGIEMAQRMGLFGIGESTAASAGHEGRPDHWVRATSHTAWGVFNCIA